MSTLEDMQAFVRVVEAGSITKAAEQLNTVKSAVSQRLNRLESRLGIQLMNRTTRTQHLTDAGQQYYQDSLRIIEEVSDAEARVQQTNRALAGPIHLAAPLSFGLNHLSRPLRQFNEIHPNVEFHIDFNDRQVDLVNEGFDLAIRIARLADSTLMAKKITHTRLVLCASPDYLKVYGTPQQPEDLSEGHHKLKYVSSPDIWTFMNDENKKVKVRLPNALTCNNGDFMRDAAIDGKGLVMIPDFVCYKAIKTGQLIPLLCTYQFDNILDTYAVYPQNRHLSLRVKKLINFLQASFGASPYWEVPAL
ncbi:LysR family transcriptional regulator [Marinicella sediminis]|uniref:LysR family transcriptional regulator n=1 Tax=Marinicella sediminis TaxID=1792834 RepID=A0ABV7JK58_9GAMM|nr:LysR family transcriptional regulator [Marinicella sediminis]